MMSSGLAKVAKTAKSTFVSVENNIAQHMMKGGRKAEDALDRVKHKLKEVDRTASSSSFFSGGMLRKFATGLSAAAIMGFAGSSVKAAMDNEQRVQSFGVLTGSKQRGKDLAMELRSLKENTIMGASVYQNAQTMMAFGVNDKKVVTHLKQIGDIAMGNTDRMQGLTLAFSQMTAAGRLMGQDLLQFVNAGFNPLQTISEKWQEFGFKSKVSIGELKKMMEEGKISSDMIHKSFELATSKGGKFAGMMDTMAATAGGRLQMMKGQFAAFQIDAGNALMPVAEGLMDVGTNLLEVLHLSKTAPQVLMAERAELNAMVGSITQLNQGNEMRGLLLSNLMAKFPDLFSNINKETVTNGELLAMLNDVNAAYEKRIGLASSDLIIDTNNKALREAQADFTKFSTVSELLRRGDSESIKTAKTLLSWKDKAGLSVGMSFGSPTQNDAVAIAAAAKQAQAIILQSQGNIFKETKIKASKEFENTITDAYALRNNSAKMKELFGGDQGRQKEFMELTNQLRFSNGKYYTGGGGLAYAEKLKNIMTPGGATAGAIGGGATPSGAGTKAGGESVGRALAGGGPRVINVTIGKMVENLNITPAPFNESMEEVQTKVEDILLRVLNSGSRVQ